MRYYIEERPDSTFPFPQGDIFSIDNNIFEWATQDIRSSGRLIEMHYINIEEEIRLGNLVKVPEDMTNEEFIESRKNFSEISENYNI